MKKKRFERPHLRRLKKLLLTMKLSIMLTIAGLVQLEANGIPYSKSTRLTLKLHSDTVKPVFDEIEKNSELFFTYYNDIVEVDKKGDFDIKNGTINKILENLSGSTEIIDREVGVKQKKHAVLFQMLTPVEVLQQQKVTGTITDASDGEPIIGANVVLSGTTIGTVTDINGKFELTVPQADAILVVSFLGYNTERIPVNGRSVINVSLITDIKTLSEVVVVGYGVQKKETVVGAITQTGRDDLERSGGVSNLGQALTGRLPGVTTIVSTGMPGNDDPQIFIRGQSTWNNSSPLILVDGIERRMNDVDFSEVESISVLKDASATAVFGVKGAEGVILINTRRGKEGKPQISVSANQSFSFMGRLPEQLDAYEAFKYQNEGIEYELPVREAGWSYYKPMAIVNRYKTPQALGDQYVYPNVDWTDVITRDFASSNRFNLNVTGGTNFAKYFGSFAYTHEGDLLNSEQDGEANYKAKYAYNRFNYRTNLDFNISKSTVLSVNLAGYLGTKYDTRVSSEYDIWRAFYTTPPSAFPPRHEDGSWGFTPGATINNPFRMLNNSGIDKTTRTQVTTDFILKQKLDFIAKGLSVQGSLSYDNELYSNSGINGTPSLAKHISPTTGEITYSPNKGVNEYDYAFRPNSVIAENIRSEDLDDSYRRLFYQIQMNYNKKFGKNDLGVTALMNREEYAQGDMFPRYREDWVGRVTYNYDSKYLLETNSAYNGSEQFGKGYRFGFFPSLALGWVVSNEPFMNQLSWMNKFKIRYSIGKLGNDRVGGNRWAYETQWAIDGGGTTRFGTPSAVGSTYAQYKESVVGNEHLQWEVSKKQNLGFELGFLNNLFIINLDLFNEKRDNVFINSSSRNIPSYFGANPVSANLGKTEAKGYEFEIEFRKTTRTQLTYFADYSITYAKDKVIYREDPENLPLYRKDAGFQIGQTKKNIATDFITNWDEVYANTKPESNTSFRLPGDVGVLDYNGDGIINTFDDAPYGYPSRPQYTYNFSVGADYKGFSFLIQFYGVFNTTREHSFVNEKGDYPLVWEYVSENAWSPANLNARWTAPRVESSSLLANLNYFDGSYLRLKTAEIGYTFEKKWIKKLSLSSLKFYVNGNNLFFWSKLPEDRESTQGNRGGTQSLYPTLRRVNIGLTANF